MYYNSKIDNIYDAVEHNPENIVAFVSVDYKWAFVLNQYMDKFKEDTLEYNMTYINVDSFDNEIIKCSDIELLSREFNYVTWIDDDFMNDENLVFNYESFYKIDEYVKYLNTNHFSVMQLIKFPIIFKQNCALNIKKTTDFYFRYKYKVKWCPACNQGWVEIVKNNDMKKWTSSRNKARVTTNY